MPVASHEPVDRADRAVLGGIDVGGPVLEEQRAAAAAAAARTGAARCRRGAGRATVAVAAAACGEDRRQRDADGTEGAGATEQLAAGESASGGVERSGSSSGHVGSCSMSAWSVGGWSGCAGIGVRRVARPRSRRAPRGCRCRWRWRRVGGASRRAGMHCQAPTRDARCCRDAGTGCRFPSRRWR